MAKEYWNGAEAAHRRVMMKAAGYSDEDIRKKPHIGVPNSFMEGSPGTAHLRRICDAVKEGIWAAGGVPVEFGIPATCGNVANGSEEMKYEQMGRDIVAMSIEFVSRIHHFDGLAMIASCDLIIAGCYLAAMRLDLPAMVVTGGSMTAGQYCGKTVVEADLDVARFSGADERELFEMEECVCPSYGACPSMGTANTMQMLGEMLDKVEAKENKVIHSLEHPVSELPGLKIMYGNIAPKGAIVRPTAVYEEVRYIKGKAKVFEGDYPAFAAIQNNEIVPGDILVIRYEGCKGAPDMKELMLSIDALIAKGLDKSCGLVTDARFSGFNFGAIIGHVSPEAFDGGVIALVENGDEIEIDIPGGTVNLLVSEEELAERKKNWVQPPLKQEKGCLNIYAQMCRPAEEGGAMQPWPLDARYS